MAERKKEKEMALSLQCTEIGDMNPYSNVRKLSDNYCRSPAVEGDHANSDDYESRSRSRL